MSFLNFSQITATNSTDPFNNKNSIKFIVFIILLNLSFYFDYNLCLTLDSIVIKSLLVNLLNITMISNSI